MTMAIDSKEKNLVAIHCTQRPRDKHHQSAYFLEEYFGIDVQTKVIDLEL
jgi:hypothetical protein